MFYSLCFCFLPGLLAKVACGSVGQSPHKLGGVDFWWLGWPLLSREFPPELGAEVLAARYVLWSSQGSSRGQDTVTRRGGLDRHWESWKHLYEFWLPAWSLVEQGLPLELWAGIPWIFTFIGRNAYLTYFSCWIYIHGVTGCVFLLQADESPQSLKKDCLIIKQFLRKVIIVHQKVKLFAL